MCGVGAIQQIVGVHYRIDVGFGDRCFEGRQIDFAQSALIHFGVGVVAAVLLIVGGEMLDRGHHSLDWTPSI